VKTAVHKKLVYYSTRYLLVSMSKMCVPQKSLVALMLCALTLVSTIVSMITPYCICAQQKSPPHVEYEPKQPKWGDTLNVRFKPSERLTLSDRIAAVTILSFSNGDRQTRLYTSTRRDSVVVCRIPVEKDVAAITLYFEAELSWAKMAVI
jgi:hypothetical protein